jgi:Cys-tRNA(Pro)/Cys-tRNA(Cys) deacylase
MTPAISVLKKKKIRYALHKYAHDPKSTAYGKEAAEQLGLSETRIFKTLVAATDSKQLIVAVLPVSCLLSMKKLAKAVGAKKAEMADKTVVAKSTGYILGGISPLGQKKQLTTFIDESAQKYATVFVSGGRRGLQLEVQPMDLSLLTRADFVDLCDQ